MNIFTILKYLKYVAWIATRLFQLTHDIIKCELTDQFGPLVAQPFELLRTATK